MHYVRLFELDSRLLKDHFETAGSKLVYPRIISTLQYIGLYTNNKILSGITFVKNKYVLLRIYDRKLLLQVI